MVFGREGASRAGERDASCRRSARASGAPQRWRIVNAAKSRFFLLDLEGQTFIDDRHRRRPAGAVRVTSEVLLVTPGERADVLVAPTGKPGSELPVRVDALQPRLRQRGIPQRRGADHASQFSADQPTVAAAPLPAISRARSRRRARRAPRGSISCSRCRRWTPRANPSSGQRHAVPEGQAVSGRSSARRSSG